MILQPLYVSKEIFELISLGSEISLHSIFNSSLNLRLNHTIVNISSNKYTLPPYGIVLNDRDFLDIKLELRNDKVQIDISKSRIHMNNIQIDLGNAAKIYDSQMMKTDHKILDFNIKILAEKVIKSGKKNGFNIENDKMLSIIQSKENYFSDQIEDIYALEFASKLELLRKFFLHHEDDQILKYFMGRGMGLTPAGDDFLVGMLSIFSLQDAFKKSILEIRNFILKNKGIYTNDISEQFLVLATENQFSRSIILLLNTLVMEEFQDEAVNNVLSYGATSGIDILLGIIFAYKIMKESDANE